MIFQKQVLNISHLSICINGVRIQPSPETVFLGFTLDSKLQWVSHLNAKAVAARKAFIGVLRCLRASWGLDRKRIMFLNLTVVEPILVYGYSLWPLCLAPRLEFKKPDPASAFFSFLLLSFQNGVNRGSSPLNSATPIHLRVAEIAVMRFRACLYEFSPASLKWLVNSSLPLSLNPKSFMLAISLRQRALSGLVV